jgi:hypothetical protein
LYTLGCSVLERRSLLDFDLPRCDLPRYPTDRVVSQKIDFEQPQMILGTRQVVGRRQLMKRHSPLGAPHFNG